MEIYKRKEEQMKRKIKSISIDEKIYNEFIKLLKEQGSASDEEGSNSNE